jgi:hypothetical protein
MEAAASAKARAPAARQRVVAEAVAADLGQAVAEAHPAAAADETAAMVAVAAAA